MRERDWDSGDLQIEIQKSELLYWAAYFAKTGIVNTGPWIKAAVCRMAGYERQIFTHFSTFLGHCLSHEKAPPIFSFSWELIKKDALPVLFASYLYSLSEQVLRTDEASWRLFSALSQTVLMAAYAVAFIYTKLRNIQFYTHTAVLQLQFPKAFYQMSSVFNPIDKTVCKDCTVLRYSKGEIRDILVLLTQPIGLWLMQREILYFSPIAYPVQYALYYLLSTMFSGQAIFAYPLASAGLCERHRRENVREYPGLCFMLGASHFLLSKLFSAVLTLSTWAPEYVVLHSVGNVPVVSQLLSALSNIPFSVHETYLSGIVMLFMIGLAHYIRFGTTVSESKGWWPELTYIPVDYGIDVGVLRFKRDFKKLDKSTATELWDVKSVIESVTWYVSKIKDCVMWIATQMMINDPAVIKSARVFMPPLFSNDSIFKDKLLRGTVPGALNGVNNVLDYILRFRASACDIVDLIKKIDEFCCKTSVQILSWCLGLSTVTTLLTVDFLVVKSPKYFDELLSWCVTLIDLKLMSEEFFDEIQKKVSSIKNNLSIVRPVLSDLPREGLDQLLEFVRSETFTQWLETSAAFFSALLEKNLSANQKETENEGFQVVAQVKRIKERIHENPDDAYVAVPSKVADRCEFPSRSQLGFHPDVKDSTVEVVAVASHAATSALPKNDSWVHLSRQGSGEFDGDIPSSKDFGGEYADVAEVQAAALRQLQSSKKLGGLIDSANRLTANLSGKLKQNRRRNSGSPDTQPSFVRLSQ